MNKCIICTLLISLSCLKFEFESPYEDLNGIYLQLVQSYTYSGEKLLIEEQKGYILDHSSNQSVLKMYSFMNLDSIYEINNYVSSNEITDFVISSGYAYCASPSYGLEIINFNDSIPAIRGNLEISGGAEIIRLQNDYAYLAGDSNFYVIDVSDKDSPQKIGEFNFSYDITSFEVDSNYAYIILCYAAFRILDIKYPNEPHLLYQNNTDWYYMFALNKNYLYLLPYSDPVIETHEITDSCSLEFVSSIRMPYGLDFIYADTKYGLACDWLTVYLLNLEYPSAPCVSEAINLTGYPKYGIIEENYIYLLTPSLSIIEIKETSQ